MILGRPISVRFSEEKVRVYHTRTRADALLTRLHTLTCHVMLCHAMPVASGLAVALQNRQ
jgi:hypothetical protein